MTITNQGNDDDPLVELSVSGTLYTLRKEVLTDNDWMLSKIVGNEIPWALHHNGRYFIDADPEAFRWVLYFIRCNTLPSGVIQSKTEMDVIRNLADFLCFEPLLAYLDEKIAACDEIQAKIETLEENTKMLKRAHSDEIALLKDHHTMELIQMREQHEKEMKKMRKQHEKEMKPLQQTYSSVNKMDGIKFRKCCNSVVLWPTKCLNVDRTSVVCPVCKKARNMTSRGYETNLDLVGTREEATTASHI